MLVWMLDNIMYFLYWIIVRYFFFLIAVTEETLCVGLARVGAEDQKIAAGTLQQMCTVDLGGPLHSLIITGDNMHPLEMEMLSLFSIPEKSSGSQSIDGLWT